jgi:hypothetical protein
MIRTTGRSNSRGLGPVSNLANGAVAPGPEWRFVCRREVFRVFCLGGTYGVYTSGNCLEKTKLASVLPLGLGESLNLQVQSVERRVFIIDQLAGRLAASSSRHTG